VEQRFIYKLLYSKLNTALSFASYVLAKLELWDLHVLDPKLPKPS
jgi:hypothetical protein